VPLLLVLANGCIVVNIITANAAEYVIAFSQRHAFSTTRHVYGPGKELVHEWAGLDYRQV
jgi:hypothetical protein